MHKTKKGLLNRNLCVSRFPYIFSYFFLINDFGVAERSSCHHKEPTTPPANAVASTRIPYTMPSMPLKHLLPKLNALGTFQIPCFWRCGHAVHGDIKLKRLRNKLGRMHSTLHHVCLNRFPGNGSIFVSLSKTAVSRILESPLNPQSNQKKQPFNVTSFSWIQKNSGFLPPGARTKIRCRKASVKSLRRTSQRHHQRTELNLRKRGFLGANFEEVSHKILSLSSWLALLRFQFHGFCDPKIYVQRNTDGTKIPQPELT